MGLMRRRTNHKDVIDKMEKEMAQKLRLVQKLNEENAALHLKHQVFTAFCESLDCLRQQSALSDRLATASEQLLLEQLNSLPCSIGTSTATDISKPKWASTPSADSTMGNSSRQVSSFTGDHHHSSNGSSGFRAAAPAPTLNHTVDFASGSLTLTDDDTLPAAPESDCLLLFKLCMGEPMQPPAVGSNPKDMKQELLNAAAEMVKDMSYSLHLHESGNYKHLQAAGHTGLCDPIQQIQTAFLKYQRLLSWHVLADKGDLVTRMTLTSHDGSDVSLQEHSNLLYKRVVRQLGLSSKQLYLISQGLRVLTELRKPVQDEQRQLRDEITASAPSSSSGSGISSSSSSGDEPDGNAGNTHTTLYNHLGKKNLQEARLARMRLLLSKELLITVAMKGYAFGCMTWPQIAKAFVLFAPFTMSIVPLAAAMLEYHEEHKQQEQQQQQQYKLSEV